MATATAMVATGPPDRTIPFPVLLVLNFGVDDGTVDVDFESGDFRVTCPGILLIRDA